MGAAVGPPEASEPAQKDQPSCGKAAVGLFRSCIDAHVCLLSVMHVQR